MSCQPIKMPDGTVVLANVRPGAKLTERDKKVLAEYVEFCRARAAKAQRKRNLLASPGGSHADPS